MKLLLFFGLLFFLQPAFCQKDTVELKEAVITGRKPPIQQRPDGIVVNVESSILSKGSTALEVLERSPGVLIDRRNNNIFLNGKDGVMVMLNGKLLRMSIADVMTLLQGLSADDIDKIELLSTPGAKYDAEGSAGLINIVLKKNRRKGTSGNVAITAGYGWREKMMSNFNLAHSGKILDAYATYNFSHDRTYSDVYITGTNDFPELGGLLAVIFLDTTRTTKNNHTVTAGLEARVSPKTTLGASLIYGNDHTEIYAINNAGYNVLPDSLLSFEGHIKIRNYWQNLVSSVWMEKRLREGEKINFDLDYLRYVNNNPSDITSSFTNKHGDRAGTNNDSLFSPRQRGAAHTVIDVGVIKLDYDKQLNKKIKIEAGIKGTYTQTRSISGLESQVDGEWVHRTEASNDVSWKEGIGAAYTSVSTQLDSTCNLVLGLRYEYSNMQPLERRLSNFFPDIAFSKKLSSASELQLSYTTRITRPTYNDLASFVGYTDPVAVFTGNPLLQPTITRNLKVGYSLSSYTFSVLLSRDYHPIVEGQLTESPARDLMYVSPQNLRYRNSLTFQANLPWRINDWWSSSYSITAGWKRFGEDYTVTPLEKTFLSYSGDFTQTFTLPKNFSAELSGWYNSLVYGGTVRVDGFGAFNAGVKKELKNNAGTLQLSVSDILRTAQVRVHFGTLTREAFATESHVSFNPESRIFPIFKLTYSRSFGTGYAEREKKGAADEMDRVRKN